MKRMAAARWRMAAAAIIVADLERVIVEADAASLRCTFTMRRYEQMRDFRIQAHAMPKAFVRAAGDRYEALVLALWCCAKHAGAERARRLEVVRLVFDGMARFLYSDLNPWFWTLVTEGGGAAARAEAGLAPLTRRQRVAFLLECVDALVISGGGSHILNSNTFLRTLFHRISTADNADAGVTLRALSKRFAALMDATDACFFVHRSLIVASSAPSWLPVFLNRTRMTAEHFHKSVVYGRTTALHVAAESNPLCLPCLLGLHDPLARNLDGDTARMVLSMLKPKGKRRKELEPAKLEELDAMLAQAEARLCPSLRGAVVLAGLRDRGSAVAGLSIELAHAILALALPDPARYHAPPMIDNALLALINPL